MSQTRQRREKKILSDRRERPYFGKGRHYVPLGFVLVMPSFSAILTSSGRDRAPIFLVSWDRWTLTVASLTSIKAAICLLRRPETTRGSISRSRLVRDLKRSRSTLISASLRRRNLSFSSAIWTASSKS